MDKIKITAVSYLNTKPFLYGLEHSGLMDRIELSLDIPSIGAAKLRSGEVDMGLTPVASLLDQPDLQIVSDYCIGSERKVETVCLFAEVPMEKIRRVYLDYQSKTSVQLIRVLMANHWHHQPEFSDASEGYEDLIRDDTAGLIIGDRAITYRDRFPYQWDLGREWYEFSGLPFVYALWLSRLPLDREFIQAFDRAMQYGIDHIPEVVNMHSSDHNTDMQHYLQESISYHFDADKKKGLEKFLAYCRAGLPQTKSVDVSG